MQQDDLLQRLREEEKSLYGTHPCGLLHDAADRIEALERINREMPSILKYLEEEARPIGTENGLVPNKALILLNNLRMAVENTWIV